MILSINSDIEHVIVADWPGQLFIQKALLTHLRQQNSRSTIPSAVNAFIPILGPLHVSLNSRVQVIIVYYSFLKLWSIY